MIPADLPVGTVLAHPDRPLRDAAAPRLMKVQTTHPGEWPWRRITGLTSDVPPQGADLSAWTVQPLGDLGLVLGHPTVFAGHEVTR